MLKKAVFFLLIFLFYCFIRNSYFLFGGDILYQGIPWIKYNIDTNFPLWNDALIGGFSNIASISLMFFHPLTLLLRFKLVGVELFFSIMMASYLFIAAASMYYWIRVKTNNNFAAFTSAVIFTLGGFTANCVFKGHYMLLGSYCLYPLIFFIAEKILNNEIQRFKFTVHDFLFILIFALQILAGHPQQVYYQCLILFPYIFLANKKKIKTKISVALKIGFLCFISALLCAAQLLPTYCFSKEAVRPVSAGINIAHQYSSSLNHLVQTIFPFFWGNSITDNFYLSSFEDYSQYIGICVIILLCVFIFKKKRREELFWWGIIIISILLALGQYFPLYELFYNYVPGFKMFRAPIRLFSLALFATAILAGFTIESLFENAKQNHRNQKLIIFILFITIILILLFIFIPKTIILGSKINTDSSFLKNLRRSILSGNMNNILQNVRIQLAAGILFALCLLLFFKSKFYKTVLGLLLIIIIGELSFFFFTVTPKKINIESLKPNLNSEVYKRILSDSEIFRIKYYENQQNINKNSYIPNLRNIDGYQNIISSNIALFQCFVNKRDDIDKIIKSNRIFFENIDSLEFSLTGVKYLISNKKMEFQNWDLILSDSANFLYRNKNRLPIFFPVRKILFQKNNDYNFQELEDVRDYSAAALVSAPLKNYETTFDTASFKILDIQYLNDEIHIQTMSDKPQFAVLLEPYDKNWLLYVDNKKDNLYRTNLFFFGFNIPSGKANIVLRYKPYSYATGVLISSITLFLLNVIFLSFVIKYIYAKIVEPKTRIEGD
ncbi:MAG TPA: YfhO family protein [bacterium]|nr:YfhO family protein [bacterium]HPN31869.1 YfhO family protein [bacterium]